MPDEKEDDLLTAEQVAGRLKLSTDTLDRIIKMGVFPMALDFSPGTKLWTIADVRRYKEWVEFIKPRLMARKAKDDAE